MTPDDPLARLRDADPAARLGDEAGADARPPADVKARIMATSTRGRASWLPRRRLVVAVLAAAAATAAGLALLLPSERHADLAAKAYAATAPGDRLVYTELTFETVMTPGAAGPEPDRDRTESRMWQYRDRSHRISSTVTVTGRRAGQRWNYEYDKRGNVFRTLNPNGAVDTIRLGDRGLDPEEVRGVLRGEQQTMVERFRERYADKQLRDVGETTFAGRPAYAYEVDQPPKDEHGQGRRETFYLDPDSGLPLGRVEVLVTSRAPPVEFRFTETVRRFERLPPTAENLAKLDAPAIDAGRPRK